MRPAPPTLVGTYVVAYVHVDESVVFVQRNHLSVEGEALGRVPCLAICEDFDTSEFMIQYCDDAWETLAIAAGLKTLEQAKQAAELSYLGISGRWCDSLMPKSEALALHKTDLAEACCSFCGRTPLEVDMMFGADAKICNHCVQSFNQGLSSEAEPT